MDNFHFHRFNPLEENSESLLLLRWENLHACKQEVGGLVYRIEVIDSRL